MDIAKHCYLCENKDFDVLRGMNCGLTGERPAFEIACPVIKFDKTYEERIKEVNIELDKVQRSKTLTYSNFYFFLALSVIIVLSGIFLGNFIFESGDISTVPLIIIAVGLGVLPMASGPLNKYRTGIKIAINKKNELDQILRIYSIGYNIEIETSKDLHGNEDYDVSIDYYKISP